VTVRLSPRSRPSAEKSRSELSDLETELSGQSDPERRKALLARRAAVRMELYYREHPYQYAVRSDADNASGPEGDFVEVQTLRLGNDTVIVGLPGEPFPEIGDEIRRRSGIPNVLVAGYANEAIGYIPVATEFPSDGYEVGCARFTPDAAQSLVDGALRSIAAASA
jgi:hypothetical protein